MGDKIKEEHNYQVLTKVEGFWEQADKEISPGAFQVAHTAKQKPLYLARSCRAKSHVFGLVSKAGSPSIFAFNKEVIKKSTYEVLVSNWQSSKTAHFDKAFVADQSSHLLIGRAKYRGLVIPGYVKDKKLYIAYEGVTKSTIQFELLISNYFKWAKPNGHSLPSESVQAGIDLEYHSVYICKHSFKGGKVVIGKVANDQLRLCYYALNGHQYATERFEVLVHDYQPRGNCPDE